MGQTTTALVVRSAQDNGPEARVLSETSVTDGKWHNGIMVVNNDKKTLQLYLDGKLQETKKIATVITDDNIGVTVGIWEEPTSYGCWDGDLDDIRIYDRAMNSSDIKTLYKYESKK